VWPVIPGDPDTVIIDTGKHGTILPCTVELSWSKTIT
jgi:hypothetical protein